MFRKKCDRGLNENEFLKFQKQFQIASDSTDVETGIRV